MFGFGKKSKVAWKENGWTVIQEGNKAKHILEMSCFCEGGIVKEVVCRHGNSDEEIKYTGELKNGYSLPMSLEEFKTAFDKGLMNLK